MKNNFIKTVLHIIFILTIIFSTNVSSNENKQIDLRKSFITIETKNYAWRTAIQSVLISENNTYYLMKEVMAEKIGDKPFSDSNRHLFLLLIDNEKEYVFRTNPVGHFKKSSYEFKKKLIVKKIIKFNEVENQNLHQVYASVNSLNNTQIFCSIDYKFKEKKYTLITNCDYLNFSNSDKKLFIQPALGYVPFVDETSEYKSFGYAALFVSEKNGKLEFILNDSGPIFDLYDSDNILKKFAKRILNFLTSFKVKNSFSKVISIDNAELKFFVYKN